MMHIPGRLRFASPCTMLMALVLLVMFGVHLAPARAQEFPAHAVRMVIPYPAGGTTDILGRTVAQRLSERWKQPVLVENRAGASGSIGAAFVARAAPDGYTLVLGNSASHGAYELLNPGKAPYDSLRDFAPITLLAIVKQVLVVPSAGDMRSIPDLVAQARTKAGRMNYGSSSIGGAPHLAMELFKQVASVDIVHIPFNGAAPAMTALLGGSIDVMFAAVPTATDMVRAGRIRALGMASSSRSGMLPDVPTMSEAGMPGVEMDSWFGLLAPAGMPRDLLARLNADTVRAVDGDETRDSFARLGFERATGTPEALTALMKNERERVGRVVRQANIKGE